MSEKLTHGYEQNSEYTTHPNTEVVSEKHDKNNEHIENNTEIIESLKRSVKHEAISKSETHIDKGSEHTPSHTVIQKHHKKHAYKQTLKSVRRQLPITDRAF